MKHMVSGPSRLPAFLLAVGLASLLTAAIGAFAWVASSSDFNWTMGGGHMGRTMGGGGRNSSGDAARQGALAETITIENFAYAPGNLQIPVGGKVTWINRDSAPHSATDSGGAWDTGVLAKGESKTVTFGSRGTFDYYCSVHPNMKARLAVQ